MSDNTIQFRWIVTIQGNLAGMYADSPDVFVAADLLWYPVEGQPGIRTAPDTLVAFGRPKGDRQAYLQWREGGIAPQVVFEIQSPRHRPEELDRQFAFYERYGAEEYYLYDPDSNTLCGWTRQEGRLQPIPYRDGWVSPRLGIRFDLSGEDLVIYRPDGKRFFTFVELAAQMEQADQAVEEARRARAEAERRTEQERQEREAAERLTGLERRAKEQERQAREEAESRVGQERQARQEVESRVGLERQLREQAQRSAVRLAERLRALGIDPEV